MKDLEPLRLQALLSITKGEGVGHPFRGNQWTRRASVGRAAPKDPTAGSQGGGSGAGLPPHLKDLLKRTNDEFENNVLAGYDEGFKKELRRVFQDGMREGERIVNEETRTPSGVSAKRRQLGLDQGIVGVDARKFAERKGMSVGMTIADHWKYRAGSDRPLGLKSPPASAKDILARVKETKAKSGKLSPKEQKQVDFIEEAKLSPKAIEHYLSLSDKGKGSYRIWHRTSELMAEVRTSQYKGYGRKEEANRIREALKSKGSSSSGTTPKPAKAPTAPKAPKKKTKKEKDAEWEVLTPKQKKIYEKAPADMSHDEAIALALGK